MTASLIATCVWIVVAFVSGILPSRDGHWRAATVLIAAGIPLLGWLTYDIGPVPGLVALAAGGSILRWPILLLWQRIRRMVQGPAE